MVDKIGNQTYSDLLISDSRNSRVIRITIDGELIEIIGRRGEGPGEFLRPWELAFAPESQVLWVVDNRTTRVSKFEVGQYTSSYLSSFIAPQVRTSGVQNLILEDTHTFWFNSHISDMKISLIDDLARTIRSFGTLDFTLPNNASRNFVNSGVLGKLDDDTLVFVGRFVPVVELWSKNGDMLSRTDLILPEITDLLNTPIPSGATTKYIQHAITYNDNGFIYIYVKQPGTNTAKIYELSIDTVTPNRCFIFEDISRRSIAQFIMIEQPGKVCFYVLDWVSGIKVIQRFDN